MTIYGWWSAGLTIAALACCMAAATVERATSAAAMSTAAKATTGKPLFLSTCSPCHGAKGQGNEGPTLAGTPLPASQIALTIKVGVPGEMPSFGKRFTAAQRAQIAAYVKGLPPIGK